MVGDPNQPHELQKPPENTLFVVRDGKNGTIHVAETVWSYKLDDPARQGDIAILNSYVDNADQRVEAARMVVVGLSTMAVIKN